MEHFFELCEDKYYVVSKQSVTAKKFLATCNYLASYNDYPACCDRIIIYFAGHGRDGYIRLDIDYSDIQKEKDSKKLKRREDNERLEESKIDIEHILSIFRHHTIKKKMSIILLLDACCNAESVECEEHELVASAASETASKKFGAKSDHSGGYWTNTLFYVLNKTDEKYDIIKLLKEAQIKIKEIYNDEELNPTFVDHLQREICFRKRTITSIDNGQAEETASESKDKDLVDQLRQNLRDSYTGTGFFSEDTEWPPDQPKEVINVVTMSHAGKRTKQELMEIAKRHKVGTPGVDELVSPTALFSPTTKVTKNIADIFSTDPTCRPFEPPQRILIEGAPGIGKTVLVKETAYKWATDELLTDKKLLIVLFLRDHYVQSIGSLSDLLGELTQHEDEMLTDVKRFVNRNSKDVAFLIDGFDEYPVELRSKKPFIYQLIRGKVLSKSTVAVTSRPNATGNLFDIVHKRVEILGFAEEQRNNYIKVSLKEARRKKLKEHLDLNPIINNLCYVPLHLAILLYLFKRNYLPKTLTKTNELFVLHTIYHHLKSDLPGDITEIKHLPESIYDIIVKLSKMAYIGLKVNMLVFTHRDVEKLCPEIIRIKEAANGYGLLQAIQHHSYKKGVGLSISFNFLHLTMQEFLAAYYISTLPPEQQFKMFDSFWKDHLSFMWMMYIGLTGTHHSSPFSQFVATQQQQMSYDSTENRKKGLHLFQCFLEANNTETISPDRIPGLFANERIDLQGMTLLPYDVLSVTSFLAKSPHKWKYLNLENCHIGDTGMRILKHFLCNSHYKEKTSAIEGINIFGNDLTSLHDSYCSIIKNGYFKKFSMSKRNLSNEFIVKILDALKTNMTIKSFNLSHNGFGIDSSKAIAAYLETNSTLEELDISNNCVGADGAVIISDALCNNTVLKNFDISHNDIRDKGAIAFSKCLTCNSTLKELNISWNSISSDGIYQVALSLSSLHQVNNKANTTLEALNLSHNNIEIRGVRSLSLMLHNNSSLKTLNISHSSLFDNEVAIIVDSVKDNTTLCNLDMSRNNFTSSAKIVELFYHNKHLSSLNLQQFNHENPYVFGMDILRSIDLSNHSIKWLGLPGSSEESQLNKVMTAINQSRNARNINHLTVEYYR